MQRSAPDGFANHNLASRVLTTKTAKALPRKSGDGGYPITVPAELKYTANMGVLHPGLLTLLSKGSSGFSGPTVTLNRSVSRASLCYFQRKRRTRGTSLTCDRKTWAELVSVYWPNKGLTYNLLAITHHPDRPVLDWEENLKLWKEPVDRLVFKLPSGGSTWHHRLC